MQVATPDGLNHPATVSVSYASGTAVWLSVNGFCPTAGKPLSVTAPTTLILAEGCQSGGAAGIQPVTITFAVTDTSGIQPAMTTATLGSSSQGTVSASGTPGGMNLLTLQAAAGGSAPGSIQLTTTNASPISYTASVANPGASTWLTVTGGASGSVAAGNPANVQVTANAAGLNSSPPQGTVQIVYGNNSTLNVTVSFNVGGTGAGSGTTGSGSSLAPATLQFNYQTDGTQGGSLPSQNLLVTGTQTFSVTATGTSNSTNWLSVTPLAGTAPEQLTVSVTATGLAAGSYQGTVQVSFNDGTTQTTTVNLTVMTGSPLVYAQPGTIIINQQSGSVTKTVTLSTTNGSSVPVSLTATPSLWLSLPMSPPTTTQTSFMVTANTSGLSNGVSLGNVAVNYGTSVLNIPVVVYLTNGTGTGGNGTLSFSPSSITLNAQGSNSTPPSAMLNLSTSSTTTTFVSAAVSETTCTQASWLSLNGFQGANIYAGFSQPITVSANPAGLPVGSCAGLITFTNNGVTQSVPVTFNIGGNSSGGGITLSPTPSLSFSYTSGGTVPGAQTVTVSTTSTSVVGFTDTLSGSNCGWVTLSPSSSSAVSGTPATLTLTPSSSALTGMAPGSYSCTLVVTPASGTASNLTLNLTVSTPTASPTSVTFSYQAGGAAPAVQNVTISGGSFTASASSTGNWLSITPTSGATGTTISVSVDPRGLSAGTYDGTVTVTGANGGTGTSTVTVTLTVTVPLPTVTQVVNAASFIGGATAPGEIISIGGTSLGPTTPAFLTLDSNGNVTKNIGGVTVTIGGYAAPLTYASSTQINAVVPYEVAGQIAPVLVVKYLGQASNGFPLQAAPMEPAIFSQNASGTGPGAILNQDYTLNGPNHPAAKGTVIQVFMTGEGKTLPAAVTGKVNNVSDPSQLPVPLIQPVSALVGGQPAQVLFAGEAPGAVSGILQVNVVIPSTLSSGAVPIAIPIVISVGTAASQAGVTVSVQ